MLVQLDNIVEKIILIHSAIASWLEKTSYTLDEIKIQWKSLMNSSLFYYYYYYLVLQFREQQAQ